MTGPEIDPAADQLRRQKFMDEAAAAMARTNPLVKVRQEAPDDKTLAAREGAASPGREERRVDERQSPDGFASPGPSAESSPRRHGRSR
jgi:hypothetical protein